MTWSLERITSLTNINIDPLWEDTKDQYALMTDDVEAYKNKLIESFSMCEMGLPWLLTAATHSEYGLFNLSLGYIENGIWTGYCSVIKRIPVPELNGARKEIVGPFVEHLKEYGCTGQILRSPVQGRTATIMFEAFNSMTDIYSSVATDTEVINNRPFIVCYTTFA